MTLAVAEHSAPAEALTRIAAQVSATVESCVAKERAAAGSDVVKEMLLASAALKTAAEQVEVRGDEQTALVIARTLVTRAAEVARQSDADQELLRAAASCDAAAILIERALAVDVGTRTR